MTSSHLNEMTADTIVRDLHLLLEAMVESFDGDLHALTNDARQRQQQSGCPVWRRKSTNNAMHPSDTGSLSGGGQSTRFGG